jgi:hypothetical protein
MLVSENKRWWASQGDEAKKQKKHGEDISVIENAVS